MEPFPETTHCDKCGGRARIMFVVFEGSKSKKYVSYIRENGGLNDYWVHDAIACAVYLCASCFKPIAILNQA